MDYENVLGESKFPPYEQLKSGLIRLIEEGKITREDAGMLLPELRESEDERIRKSLFRYFEKFKPQDMWDERFSIGDVLAYIEKQKDHFRDDTKMVEKQDYSSLNDLERAIHRGFISAGVENVPVAIIKETAKECLEQMKPSEINVKALLEADRLASAEMTGRLKERNEILENPEKYNLCKPAEWSEEDEKMRQRIIRHIESEYQDWCKDKYGNSEIISDGKESCRERIAWLKSLRPQPHWKPSEEQMEALKAVIDSPTQYQCIENKLKTLYDELKKL